MRQLAGRTAIVTGASRGIGPFIARALAAERVNLALAARSVEDLERVALQLREAGARAIAVPADIASDAGRATLIEGAIAEFGAIDVLVNNAGIEATFPYHKQSPAEIAHVIDVNLTAPMLLTRAVLPGMVERRRGHFANISSLAAKVGLPCDAAYAASKGGLIAFTESIRSEFRGTGVSASVICPGYVSEAGMYDEMSRAAHVKASRLAGTSSPGRVAAAVVRCIKGDRPEAIVNPGPIRLVSTFAEFAPGAFERVFSLFGAGDVLREAARQREESAPGHPRER